MWVTHVALIVRLIPKGLEISVIILHVTSFELVNVVVRVIERRVDRERDGINGRCGSVTVIVIISVVVVLVLHYAVHLRGGIERRTVVTVKHAIKKQQANELIVHYNSLSESTLSQSV